MKLLISVRDKDEAATAVAGGADIIDIKNPDEGSLGAQEPGIIVAIARTIPRGIDVSASIGDVPNLPGTVALAGLGAALCGVRFVKVGLLGTRTPAEAARLLGAISGALTLAKGRVALVACAYADADRVGSLDPVLLPEAAAPFVEGCMIDTAIKDGRNLFDCLPDAAITRFVEGCRRRGFISALAGSLKPEELDRVRAHGADIVGIRGAACVSGRASPLSLEKVRALKRSVVMHSARAHASPDRFAAL